MSGNFGGLISGMDTNRMISQLVELERAPIRRIQNRQRAVQRDLQEISTISTAMNDLSQVLQRLSNPAEGSIFAASSDQEEALALRATQEASAGSFAVDVHQRAHAALHRSQGFAGDEVRAGTLEIAAFGEDPVVIDLAEGATLQEVRDQINASGAGVQATIIDTGTERFLSVTGTRTGHPVGGDPSEALQITETSTGGSGQPLGLSTVRTAQNAQIEIDGLFLERSDNRFDDAIEGVEFDLLQAGTGTIQVDIAADQEALREQLEKLTEHYNKVVEALQEQSGGRFGRFATDQLRAAFGNDASQLSLSFSRSGRLEIDEAGIDALLQNPGALQAVFSGESGLTARMESTLQGYTKSGGILAGTRQTLESRSRQYDQQIERQERSVDNLRQRLQNQFGQLEQAMVEMQDAQMRLASFLPMGMGMLG